MRNKVMRSVVLAMLAWAGTGLAQTAPKGPAADASAAAADDAFVQFKRRIESSGAEAKQDELLSFMKMAQESGRPVEATYALQNYFRDAGSPPAAVTLASGRLAEMAGDYKTAAIRYKRFLATVADQPATEESSGALAALLRLNIDVVRDYPAAYAAMRDYGAAHRKSPAVRKYDDWFIMMAVQRAQENRDSVKDAAALLAAALEEKLPLEQERLCYWKYLDTVMNAPYAMELKDPYGALPALKRIAGAIREDEPRRLRYALIVAHQQFLSGAAAQDKAEKDKAYEAVIAAARACFDTAPSAQSLKNITFVLSANFKDRASFAARRFAFGAEAFAKLPDAEKEQIMAWDQKGAVMGPAQWIEAGSKSADLFRRSPAAATLRIGSELTLDPNAADLNKIETYQKQAAFLQGVLSDDAAMINALAAGGDDFAKTIQVFFQQEAWHARGDAVAMFNLMWAAYSRMPHATKPADDYGDDMLVLFGQRLAQSPGVPFWGAQDFLREYLKRAWRKGSIDDRARAVQAFRWARMEDRQRDEAVRWAIEDFRRAAGEQVRQKQMTSEDFARLVKAFDEARVFSPDAAPDPLCKAVARVVDAAMRRNTEDFVKNGRDAYAAARDYAAKRTPFGESALLLLLDNHPGVDSIDLQCEVLADVLKAGDEARADMVFGRILRNRERWLTEPDGTDQPRIRKLNAVLLASLSAQLDANKFSPKAFERFRQLRSNRRARDHEFGLDLMRKMVEKRKAGAPVAGLPGCVAMMNLLSFEFAGLQKDYPAQTWFEDLYAAEIAQSGRLDYGYYDAGGTDAKGSVCSAAAAVLAKLDALPLGYGGAAAPCDEASLWRWYDRVLNSPKTDKAARDALIAKLNGAYGKTRFDWFAARVYGAYDLATGPGRADWFAKKLAVSLDRMRDAASRWPLDVDFGSLPKLGKPDALSDQELTTLARVFAEYELPQAEAWRADTVWPGHYGMDALIQYLHEGLIAKNREKDLFALIPHFWTWARDRGGDSVIASLIGLAKQAADQGKINLAVAYASGGPKIAGRMLRDDGRRLAEEVVRKGAQAFAFIPVPQSSPKYSGFRAQVAYKAGSVDEAWDAYRKNEGAIPGMIADLDAEFVTWLINQNADRQRFEQAEQISRAAQKWMEESALADPESKAGVSLASAYIAYAQKNYPTARARLEAILADQAFAGTQAKSMADLRIADVDRVTKEWDAATVRLERLRKDPSKDVRNDANILLAKVYFDKGDYKEAKDILEGVILAAPERDDAVLLSGKVDLAMRRLMDATDLDRMAETTQKRILVPGTPLRVSLQDKMASVVGHAKAIEVMAWSEKAGDEERFMLLPQGDVRTKFGGAVGTALAPVKKGDGVLQVLGDDIVHYDFTPEFAKLQDIKDRQKQTLIVRTDSDLVASSGKILSRAEQEKLAMEAEIKQELGLKEDAGEGKQAALSEVRQLSAVKPGNKINFQVEDPDRSLTAEKDQVTVDVVSSSGDIVKGVALSETEPFSGIYFGSLQTATAQPTASASDSMEGRNPNNAISPKAGYPPWVGAAGKTGVRVFTVDLADNFPLDTLKILADEPGRKLKSFSVQTSFSAQTGFKTVGVFPGTLTPWDGGLQLELVKVPANTIAQAGGRGQPGGAPVGSVADMDAIFSNNEVTKEVGYLSQKPPQAQVSLGKDVGGHAAALGVMTADEWYVGRMRAAFYIPLRKFHTFRLVDKNDPETVDATREKPLKFSFSIEESGTDAMPAASGGRGGQTTSYKIARPFDKGVHVVTVHFVAKKDDPIAFELLCDVDSPDQSLKLCQGGMFDPVKQPRIKRAVYFEPAKIAAQKDGTEMEVKFEGLRARVIRLMLMQFESEAPSIAKLTLTTTDGKALLPTQHDFMELRNNKILEVLSGDSITATYEDPFWINPSKKVRQASMSVTFSNGRISPCFVEYQQQGGESTPRYIPMVRFQKGEPINVFVSDADLDTSDKLDVTTFKVENVAGASRDINAVETEPHSGVFVGKFFPVEGEAKKEAELPVQHDETITLTYLDRENQTPGIAWPRVAVVNSSLYVEPEMRSYICTSAPIVEVKADAAGMPKAAAKAEKPASRAAAVAKKAGTKPADEEIIETYRKAFNLVCRRPEAACTNVFAAPKEGETPAAVSIPVAGPVHVDGPLMVEVLWPTIVMSPESSATLFVQTSSGRKKYGKAPQGPFDVNVPGTIMLTTTPGAAGQGQISPQYVFQVIGDPYASTPLVDGRFTFAVPKELGDTPAESLVKKNDKGQYVMEEKRPLTINGSDEIFYGFRYTGTNGVERWVTDRMAMRGDATLDIMDRLYQEPITAVYVGDKVYFRVVDKCMDVSEAKDDVVLNIKSSSGMSVTNKLVETFEHTGVFKGVIKPLFADVVQPTDKDVMPCKYGDTITVSYAPKTGTPISAAFEIFKGADAMLQPFTKKFKDPQIAVKTQFAIAEAYFEQAKKHRKLGENDSAQEEIKLGQKILEEAMRDFPDFEMRDHAEYLLANLALEFATDAKDPKEQEKYCLSAINKFARIVAEFPESQFAPKAQYKKALSYEKMNLLDQACEEYVKLSYQYPEHELIAETIARLGQYFWRKGRALRQQCQPLRESQDAKEKIEGEKLFRESKDVFRTAGEVFGRLAARFPDHNLASKTLVLSGQAWMQAEEYEKAVEVLKFTMEKYSEDPEVTPEAMYWCGNSSFLLKALPEAYKTWKKLTWDFPRTKWARYARARLSDPVMAGVEKSLE